MFVTSAPSSSAGIIQIRSCGSAEIVALSARPSKLPGSSLIQTQRGLCQSVDYINAR